jgi:hypothetical protein
MLIRRCCTEVVVNSAVIGTVVALIVLAPGQTRAQAPDLEVEAAFAYQSTYPERLNEGCGSGFGVIPSVKLRYRASRWIVGEVGTAVQVEWKTERVTGCGIAIPPLAAGSRTVLSFDGGTGSFSIVPTGRIVVTPVENDFGSLRAIAGAAWYVGRGSPAWLVGAGMSSKRSWGAVTVDVERWAVGVPYRIVRETFAPGGNRYEEVGGSREWSGHWQFRIGFAVWQSWAR